MRLVAVVNAEAGTVRRLSPQTVVRRLTSLWASLGHHAEVVVADGKEVGRALGRACRDPSTDAVILGGGDGTLSRSVKHVVGLGKSLGLLPMGTMNFVARDLGIPLELEPAAAALVEGDRRDIDLGQVNGRLFTAYASLGALPEFIRSRDKARHQGAPPLSAVFAGIAGVARRFHVLEADLRWPGGQATVTSSFLLISNNPCENAGPFVLNRRILDGGTLGVFMTRGWGPFDVAELGLQAAVGNLFGSERMVSMEVAWIEMTTRRRANTLSIDGEVVKMDGPLRFEILPRALSMLVPRA